MNTSDDEEDNVDIRDMRLIEHTRIEMKKTIEEIVKKVDEFTSESHTMKEIDMMRKRIQSMSKEGIHNQMDMIREKIRHALQNKTRLTTNKTAELVGKTKALEYYYFNHVLTKVTLCLNKLNKMEHNVMNQHGDEKHENANSRDMRMVEQTHDKIRTTLDDILKKVGKFTKESHTMKEIDVMRKQIHAMTKEGIHQQMEKIWARISEISHNKSRVPTNKTTELIEKANALQSFYSKHVLNMLKSFSDDLRKMEKNIVNNLHKNMNKMSLKGGKRRYTYPTKKRRTRKN